MRAEKLKPCPFCGSTEVSLSTYQNMVGEVDAKFGECHNCAARGPETEPSDMSDKNATSLWNNRRSDIVETAQQPNNTQSTQLPCGCGAVAVNHFCEECLDLYTQGTRFR